MIIVSFKLAQQHFIDTIKGLLNNRMGRVEFNTVTLTIIFYNIQLVEFKESGIYLHSALENRYQTIEISHVDSFFIKI